MLCLACGTARTQTVNAIPQPLTQEALAPPRNPRASPHIHLQSTTPPGRRRCPGAEDQTWSNRLDLRVATAPTPNLFPVPTPPTLTHAASSPTQDAAIALVQQLDLGPGPGGPGGRVAEEALAPEATCNPLLHRMQAFISSKALDAHAQVGGCSWGCAAACAKPHVGVVAWLALQVPLKAVRY